MAGRTGADAFPVRWPEVHTLADAAHAMTPALGQGDGRALEGAAARPTALRPAEPGLQPVGTPASR
ncbi:hypothetical protein ADK51_04350 [Streptomyces sp. WM6368]|nr:hypothetical protein ADK51_04350 [Streptomyces sp. WM6368]